MEVGDYVRFKDKRGNTYIRKVIDGYKEHWYGCRVDKEANNVPYVSSKNIIKSSPNIIDLIEKNDYVNGHKVRAIYSDGNTPYIKLEPKDKEGTRIYEKDIKSVLTHEQFENMQYNLESQV